MQYGSADCALKDPPIGIANNAQGGGGSRTAYSSGRGMDLNPELLSAIDRLCVGLVVQCMFQCRVHNLNLSLWI